MPFDQTYNVNPELCECLTTVYEILGDLGDIKLALKKGKEITDILHPKFDPLRTIGKYC